MPLKPNHDIRTMIKQANIYAYQVAEQLQVHENTLFRMLRRELSTQEKEQIIQAIEAIKQYNSK